MCYTPAMGTLIILVGIPGSGKSTWARRQTDALIVSSDAIRKEFVADLRLAHGEDAPVDNGEIFDIFHERIRQGLIAGRTVIADATNVTTRAQDNLYDIAHETGSEIELVVFTNTVLAIMRNRHRPAEQIVPDDVMNRMNANFHKLDFFRRQNIKFKTVKGVH